MSAPLPQQLHAVALHGSAKGRYAIKHSPFAGCWCKGSLNVSRPPRSAVKALSAAPVVCVAVLNITASYAKRKHRKTAALRVRIRGLYVLRPLGKFRHTSQCQIPSPAARGSKTGRVCHRPFAFCCVVGCADLSCLIICGVGFCQFYLSASPLLFFYLK